jgi:hypothetical protein
MANEENLKPFKPGQSGNPAGRPKGIPNSRTRLLRWLTLELDELNPATGETEKATLLEKMDVAIIKKALNGDLYAYKEILDRLEGQPDQNINMMPRTPEEIDAELAKLRNETEGD